MSKRPASAAVVATDLVAGVLFGAAPGGRGHRRVRRGQRRGASAEGKRGLPGERQGVDGGRQGRRELR